MSQAEPFVSREIVESLAKARAAVEAPKPPPAIDSSTKRTLEKMRDRLRDEQRDGRFVGSDYERAGAALRLREEIAAVEAVLAIIPATAELAALRADAALLNRRAISNGEQVWGDVDLRACIRLAEGC